MKILLIGGTGAMGKHLATILDNGNNKVTVTTRQPKDSNNTIEYVIGNAKDIKFTKTLLSKYWDVIIDFMLYSTEEFENRLDLLLSSTSQYVYLSSARVYDNKNTILTEKSSRILDSSTDFKYLQTNEYALIKARQENMLIHNKNKNWTILRPYITFSENRFQLANLEKESWLYRLVNKKTILLSDEFKNIYTTMTYGKDVANIITKLINTNESHGEIFNIANDKQFKWEEIFKIYLKILKKELEYEPKIVYQKIDKYYLWNKGIYQIKYDRLYDRKFDNSKLKSVIGEFEFSDVEELLENSLKEFFKKPTFGYINWKEQAAIDRITNEITKLSNIDGIKSKMKYLIFRYVKNI